MLLNRDAVVASAKNYSFGPRGKWFDEIKPLSMLHQESLHLLWTFAGKSSGPILEIGAYMGGSTIVIADGASGIGERVITIEAGGSHNHPTMPCDDILQALHRNLEAYGFADVVTVVEGWSNSPDSISAVQALVAEREIGLLAIDGDGHVDRDFAIYRPLLADGAFLLFDDYVSDDAAVKSATVRPFVDEGVAAGFLHDLGVHLWGTWAGQYVASSVQSRQSMSAIDRKHSKNA